MLGLSRPGRDPNHRDPVDLNRLAEEVVLLTGKDLARNKVRLEVQLLGRPYARVNPAQIQQVLINLLINARQAMPEGGVATLRIAPDPSGRLVELSVSDHGVGIAPETSGGSSSPSSPPRPAPMPRDWAGPAWDWPSAATSSRPITAASEPRAASARGPHLPWFSPPALLRPRPPHAQARPEPTNVYASPRFTKSAGSAQSHG